MQHMSYLELLLVPRAKLRVHPFAASNTRLWRFALAQLALAERSIV